MQVTNNYSVVSIMKVLSCLCQITRKCCHLESENWNRNMCVSMNCFHKMDHHTNP